MPHCCKLLLQSEFDLCGKLTIVRGAHTIFFNKLNYGYTGEIQLLRWHLKRLNYADAVSLLPQGLWIFLCGDTDDQRSLVRLLDPEQLGDRSL